MIYRFGPRSANFRTTVVSSSGSKLISFFDGLRPVPAYLNGKVYSKVTHKSPCRSRPSVLSRVASAVGLERIVHAQTDGCTDSGACLGCYLKLVQDYCSGGCEDLLITSAQSGGTCASGFKLAGPACGVDNGCGCNSASCNNGTSCQCH